MTTGERIKIRRKELGLSAEEIAKKLDRSPATIYRYEKGDIEKVPGDILEPLAEILETTPAYLMGWEKPNITDVFSSVGGMKKINNAIPVPTGKRIPIIGSIACGTPILAQENIEGYLSINPDDGADFCLVCKGDSMLPRCQNGDLVLIRKQPTVENGEIAAVRIGDEATLKKVYRPSPDQLMLIAENSDFPPIILTKEEINTVSIEGKAIGFVRMF
ncbi:MAG: helix-turn-helix domain-containing protein [Oscillospiraceae bacterium]|nr:helix-turn-helix domain-containing protein [Oscillospiraceae bacterium]